MVQLGETQGGEPGIAPRMQPKLLFAYFSRNKNPFNTQRLIRLGGADCSEDQ